ncbi:MAG: SDR family NAD(P)-dependent oxidoreductase, partial [Chthoniobacterales bacterium]|nr:SDR family NAD(P)-dependent oxidoreductase [Chthoniobacterales bacterium]
MKKLTQLFSLEGEIAVVIGATGALGSAMAQALAQAGATVAVCGRSRERGEKCVNAILAIGGNAAFFETNALSRESLENAHQLIRSSLGHVSILVNAAGGNDPAATVTPENPFESIPQAAWQANFDLNLVGGALLPCQVF